MFAEIPISSNLTQIRPRTRHLDLTKEKCLIKLEIKKETVWEEIISLIDQESEKSFIEESYTENNLEISEEGTKTNSIIRFNKRDVMDIIKGGNESGRVETDFA